MCVWKRIETIFIPDQRHFGKLTTISSVSGRSQAGLVLSRVAFTWWNGRESFSGTFGVTVCLGDDRTSMRNFRRGTVVGNHRLRSLGYYFPEALPMGCARGFGRLRWRYVGTSSMDVQLPNVSTGMLWSTRCIYGAFLIMDKFKFQIQKIQCINTLSRLTQIII